MVPIIFLGYIKLNHVLSIIGANVTLDGATSSSASSSCSVSATTNKKSNTLAQMTDASNTHSNSAKSNNLDVALQAFIQRFVPSNNGTIGQILQGIFTQC